MNSTGIGEKLEKIMIQELTQKGLIAEAQMNFVEKSTGRTVFLNYKNKKEVQIQILGSSKFPNFVRMTPKQFHEQYEKV